ncbi:MAG: hypothetical protein ACWGMZ_13195 [Thermoguttaceae bacterium]
MSSVGPLSGVLASAAGAPLAQTKGSDLDHTSQDVGAQQRQVANEQKAEMAAGVGQTDGEDHQTDERDADGRLPWKQPPETQQLAPDDSAKEEPHSRDVSGESGNLLDLSG